MVNAKMFSRKCFLSNGSMVVALGEKSVFPYHAFATCVKRIIFYIHFNSCRLFYSLHSLTSQEVLTENTHSLSGATYSVSTHPLSGVIKLVTNSKLQNITIRSLKGIFNS